jgi:hypothetical protein
VQMQQGSWPLQASWAFYARLPQCSPHPLHASAALGAGPTQSASGPVRSRPTRSGRAAIGHQPQNRMEAAPSVRMGAKLHTTQSPEPAPASPQTRAQVCRGALSPSRPRCGARRYSPGDAAPGTSRSVVPGSYISTAKRTCGCGSRGGKSAGKRNEGADAKEGRRALQSLRGRQGQAANVGRGRAGWAMAQQTLRQNSDETAVRVTAADAPTAHPLLQPVSPALSEAAADCDSRVLS